MRGFEGIDKSLGDPAPLGHVVPVVLCPLAYRMRLLLIRPVDLGRLLLPNCFLAANLAIAVVAPAQDLAVTNAARVLAARGDVGPRQVAKALRRGDLVESRTDAELPAPIVAPAEQPVVETEAARERRRRSPQALL